MLAKVNRNQLHNSMEFGTFDPMVTTKAIHPRLAASSADKASPPLSAQVTAVTGTRSHEALEP